MTTEQKAQIYGELLNEHTRLSNKISEIKGQNLELNNEQKKLVDQFQNRQIQIMADINKLLS